MYDSPNKMNDKNNFVSYQYLPLSQLRLFIQNTAYDCLSPSHALQQAGWASIGQDQAQHGSSRLDRNANGVLIQVVRNEVIIESQ